MELVEISVILQSEGEFIPSFFKTGAWVCPPPTRTRFFLGGLDDNRFD